MSQSTDTDRPGRASAIPGTPRIALDAFGGDHCPVPEVHGAIEAARNGVHVVLVGDRPTLDRELARFPDGSSLPVSVHHAAEVIKMDDSPARAVRNRPDASMPVCFDLVKAGDADAVMSAGHSGAMLACGLFKYRRIKGIDRPALVTSLPTPQGWVELLDVGANVDCRPLNLVQFAVMGAVYSRFKHGKPRPTVGLLSNGTEDGKGTALTRAAHQLLSSYPAEGYEYIGYIEGNGLMSGEVDVVVCDGFTGNVALKVAEATGRLVGHWVRSAVKEGGWRRSAGALLLRPAFDELGRRLDPETYGSAPLLGVEGPAFICHGGASSFAIGHAIGLAARSVTESLTPQLREALLRQALLLTAAREFETNAASEGAS